MIFMTFGYNRDKFRVRSPVKSFRDLEVYQKTVQLSSEVESLGNTEMNKAAARIPRAGGTNNGGNRSGGTAGTNGSSGGGNGTSATTNDASGGGGGGGRD